MFIKRLIPLMDKAQPLQNFKTETNSFPLSQLIDFNHAFILLKGITRRNFTKLAKAKKLIYYPSITNEGIDDSCFEILNSLTYKVIGHVSIKKDLMILCNDDVFKSYVEYPLRIYQSPGSFRYRSEISHRQITCGSNKDKNGLETKELNEEDKELRLRLIKLTIGISDVAKESIAMNKELDNMLVREEKSLNQFKDLRQKFTILNKKMEFLNKRTDFSLLIGEAMIQHFIIPSFASE